MQIRMRIQMQIQIQIRIQIRIWADPDPDADLDADPDPQPWYRGPKIFMPVRLSPDRMGPLGKPPAYLTLLPTRTSSHTHSYPALFELQRRYEAIRVWSYTTLIVIKAVVNRKLAVKT
jgi:hypothetical protein